MKKEKIKLLIKIAISKLLRKLPDDIKSSTDVIFTFDDDSVVLNHGKLSAAQCQQFMEPKVITFFLEVIRQTKPTQKKMDILVRHEFGHALGMNEEQAKALEK